MTEEVASTHRLPEGGDITYLDMIDESAQLGESQIQKIFAGATVLLTGSTGFLGKLFIEKLLRTCPDLKKLYLLARPKKGKDTLKRLQEQFDDVLYDKLRRIEPNFMKKIHIVEGDVSHLGLGVSEEDRQKVISEVDIIFHGAATVRFDEALKIAVEINVRGTREMILLARSCVKLKAFVHISTAYSNCNLRVIEERFYEPTISGDKLIDLIDNLDEKIINQITKGLIGDLPNTYTYSKLAAEDIVRKYSKGLPVAVFRPSIIIGTAKEPVSGWIDNVYGPTGVVVGVGLGVIHTLSVDVNNIADVVPGDMVVNGCIAAAWKIIKDSSSNYEAAPLHDLLPPIYNFVSSVKNPLTWGQFTSYIIIVALACPTIQAVWFNFFMPTTSKFWFKVYSFLFHWIPAYIIDGICILTRKPPMLKKLYTKIGKFSTVLEYFGIREWKFSNANCENLYKELCVADKKMFDFDIGAIDWIEFHGNFIKGLRVYLVKDPLETIPAAIRKQLKLKIIHYTCCTIASMLLLGFIWIVFGFIYRCVLCCS